jgi:molybdopterin-guanine dinucleotide biosynthesis protein A
MGGGRPAGAILAGGSARRLGGVAKGLELLDGSRIVDRVAAALGDVADELILIGAPAAVAAALPGVRTVDDEVPGSGPLGAIVTALRATGRDTIVVAWDMPFVTAKQLQPLLAAPDDAEAVVWESAGHVEPLCALYRASALRPLADAFAAGERSPREALRRLHVHLVQRPADDGSSPFASVNTPEELAAARGFGRDDRR